MSNSLLSEKDNYIVSFSQFVKKYSLQNYISFALINIEQ